MAPSPGRSPTALTDEFPRPGRSRWSRTVDGRFGSPIPAPRDEQAGRKATATPGGRETILLVEDQTQLREAARTGLERLGYEVWAAPAADEALRWVRDGGALDLLLTDVVLPGMNGVTLAERVVAERSGVRVLFISGYTSEACAPRGTLGGEPCAFLDKPFSLHMLARAVRDVLDRAG